MGWMFRCVFHALMGLGCLVIAYSHLGGDQAASIWIGGLLGLGNFWAAIDVLRGRP